MSSGYDVFVSHASEDKRRFVDSFVAALEERGLKVWYDSNEIRLGDDFVRRMNEGLAQSRFGVVIVSPSFFKYWPVAELSALFNQEATFDQTRIRPIRLVERIAARALNVIGGCRFPEAPPDAVMYAQLPTAAPEARAPDFRRLCYTRGS